MDQVRLVLAVIKKHHFWVLGGVVLLLVLGVWWQATAGLAKQYDVRKKTLNGLRQDISNLAGTPNPPNAGVIKAIQDVHKDLTESVLKAWQYLYKQQQDNNPLPDDLGPQFIAHWNALKAGDPTMKDITDQDRDTYWNFITNYLPKQLKRADIWRPKEGQEGREERGRRTAAPGVMPEGGPAGDRDIEYVGKVVWDKENYDRFQSHFMWNHRPTPLEIRLAQEDLWVCDTLLNIVRDLNEGARSHYNAPVKRIMALDIGPAATVAFAKARNALGLSNVRTGRGGPGGPVGPGAEVPGSMPMGEGPPGQPMGEGMPGEGPMGPGMAGEGPMGPGMEMGPGMARPTTGDAATRLLTGRYVDGNGQPVPLEQGRPKQPYLQFKMMPIHLMLVMDQRKVPELMVKCANSNMPIKIRQLCLSPSHTTKVDYAGQIVTAAARNVMPMPASSFGPGSFGMGVEGPPMGNPQAMPGEDMMGAAPGLRGAGKGEGYRGPYDMPVEVFGIIYIYNVPRRDQLGQAVAAAGSATEPAPAPSTPGTTPGTTPAVPPGTTPAVPPGTTPAVPPGTTPAVPPGTKPAVPPGTKPAVPPGTKPAVPPGTTPAAPETTPAPKPGTAPAAVPAKT